MRIHFLQSDSESDNGKLVLAESLQHCPKRLATSIYISKTTFRRDGPATYHQYSENGNYRGKWEG